MNRTKTKIVIVLCVALLIMVTGYAVFFTDLNVSVTGNVTTTWKVHFTNITMGDANGTGATNAITPTYTDTTATMEADLKKPGDEMTYELTLKNSGDINAVIADIDAKATGSPAIIFSIDGIKQGDKLASGKEVVIRIKIEYDGNVTSQPSETKKTLVVTINAVQDVNQDITEENPNINQPLYLSTAILNDNTQLSDENINFGAISSDTNGKGLYATSDLSKTEDIDGNGEGEVVYYFRGNVTNNYVKFAKDANGNDMYWRIIRINEDGSIRLIYQGTSSEAIGVSAAVGKTAFNIPYQYNAHAGYMFGVVGPTTELTTPMCLVLNTTKTKVVDSTTTYPDKSSCENANGQWVENAYDATHANMVNGTLKSYVDNWYINQTNLSNYENTHLADAGFCNDRSIAAVVATWKNDDTALGYGENVTAYGAYNRVVNTKQPQFKCQKVNDLFTLKGNNKGNQALTYPVGMLTADEVVYAGGHPSNVNTKFYLYTGDYFWTMSPGYFHGGNSAMTAWHFSNTGTLGSGSSYNSRGIRPVINLNPKVEISSGKGTKDNPYIIKTN